MSKKKSWEKLLQISIENSINYRGDNGKKLQRVCYYCDELNLVFLVGLQLPTQEYFEDANIVFVRDTLVYFLQT